MRVLFTADIHIRLGQKNIPKDWAINRYNTLWSEIDRIFNQYNCDIEIHGGDIFDKLPTLEELAIYFNYISSKQKKFIIFDGNHEATKKGSTFLHYLKNMVETANNNAVIITEPTTIKGVGDFIPYTNIKDKNLVKYKNSNILYTHVRGSIPPHVTPEIDLTELKPWDLVLAGDLHSHSNSQDNLVYPGSPVTVTFHRNSVDTGVVIVDTDTNLWQWVKIEVPQLLRKTIYKTEEMIKTDYDHTIYEIVGDIVDLSKVDSDIDILDKKIIKYESQASLDLSGLTLEEELVIYLQDIMQLDLDKINKVLKVYNDNIKTVDLE